MPLHGHQVAISLEVEFGSQRKLSVPRLVIDMTCMGGFRASSVSLESHERIGIACDEFGPLMVEEIKDLPAHFQLAAFAQAKAFEQSERIIDVSRAMNVRQTIDYPPTRVATPLARHSLITLKMLLT